MKFKRPLIALLLLTMHGGLLATERRYPAHSDVVDVTQPPYSGKGDGVSDDTESLQNALDDNVGRKVLFFR